MMYKYPLTTHLLLLGLLWVCGPVNGQPGSNLGIPGLSLPPILPSVNLPGLSLSLPAIPSAIILPPIIIIPGLLEIDLPPIPNPLFHQLPGGDGVEHLANQREKDILAKLEREIRQRAALLAYLQGYPNPLILLAAPVQVITARGQVVAGMRYQMKVRIAGLILHVDIYDPIGGRPPQLEGVGVMGPYPYLVPL